MNKSTTKNLLIVLGILTAAVGGYYLVTAAGVSVSLSSSRSDSEFQSMQNRTQVFIERGRTLDQVTLDTELFENPVFISLEQFNPNPIVEQRIGRENPFNPPEPPQAAPLSLIQDESVSTAPPAPEESLTELEGEPALE